MADRSDITDDDRRLLEKYFPSERKGPKDRGEPQTFEIAIMLAGAISAGSYTAGVMDFLVEALDAWHLAKLDDDRNGRTGTDAQTVPHHKVVLRVITGASAGGMNGAIAAAALDKDFPPIYDKSKYASVTAGGAGAPDVQLYDRNPFYSAWVKSVDIMPMLDVKDIGKTIPVSILNCGILDNIARQLVQFSGPPAKAGSRAWLANPYEVRLTVTNLRGVPFAYDLKSEDPKEHQGFLMHADHMAFAVQNAQGGADEGARPDCIALSPSQPRTSDDWRRWVPPCSTGFRARAWASLQASSRGSAIRSATGSRASWPRW